MQQQENGIVPFNTEMIEFCLVLDYTEINMGFILIRHIIRFTFSFRNGQGRRGYLFPPSTIMTLFSLKGCHGL